MFFRSSEAGNTATDFMPKMLDVLGMCTSGQIDKILRVVYMLVHESF